LIVELLNHFEPEPDGLLREISKNIDDEMLEWISAANYALDADKHLVALRQLRDTGTFPDELHWFPMEVLELIRWSEPEDPAWKPGGTGEFGHCMRAFSCAAILRAEHEPYNYSYNDGSTDATVIQLILSLCALSVDFNSQALKHFSWLLLHSKPEGRNDQARVYGMGLLWFALQLDPPMPDATLLSLAQWVARRAHELNWRPSSEGRSGLREMVLDCQKGRAWELLGCELSNLDLSQRTPDLQVWVQMIGEQLVR
jgi:hypothetical protein